VAGLGLRGVGADGPAVHTAGSMGYWGQARNGDRAEDYMQCQAGWAKCANKLQFNKL